MAEPTRRRETTGTMLGVGETQGIRVFITLPAPWSFNSGSTTTPPTA
jgi:hypothetical protein